MSRKEGRRGLASIEESVNTSIQQLEGYIRKYRGRLITATRNNRDNISSNRTKMTRKQNKKKKKWEEKQLYGHFKQQTSKVSNEKTWTWLRKGSPKKETESLLIAVQSNAVRTKTRQQNSRYRLCGDRDETINHIKSECSKRALKEYKTTHDWVVKVIKRELCKKLKFDYTNKWYLDNPQSAFENEPHKLLWDFEIQTDHLISARRTDLVIVNKKKKKKKRKKKRKKRRKKKKRNCRIVDFAVPADHRVKLKESKKRD